MRFRGFTVNVRAEGTVVNIAGRLYMFVKFSEIIRTDAFFTCNLIYFRFKCTLF